MSKTVLIQTIQFSISTHFSSNVSIDRPLSGATTLVHSRSGAMTMMGYSTLPKAPALLEPHHLIG